jgi:hypothetical protein
VASRIQRSRQRGWRMPATAVYVGRPTKFGNPFTVAGCLESGFADDEGEARKLCADAFRRWLDGESTWDFYAGRAARDRILADLPELRGRDLVCWCSIDQPCHADSLLELANR